MRIVKEDSIAVIVDIQERLVPHMYQSDSFVKNTKRLIEGLQLLNIPIIITQQYTKGLGETISPVKDVFTDFNYIEKITFSCLGEETFTIKIKESRSKYVIVAGIETHVCILQTVLDLLDSGYTPVVVQDCVSSRNIENIEMALRRMRKNGAIITTSESLLFELLQRADSPEFKAISKLVK